eukprot:gene3647-2582_t
MCVFVGRQKNGTKVCKCSPNADHVHGTFPIYLVQLPSRRQPSVRTHCNPQVVTWCWVDLDGLQLSTSTFFYFYLFWLLYSIHLFYHYCLLPLTTSPVALWCWHTQRQTQRKAASRVSPSPLVCGQKRRTVRRSSLAPLSAPPSEGHGVEAANKMLTVAHPSLLPLWMPSFEPMLESQAVAVGEGKEVHTQPSGSRLVGGNLRTSLICGNSREDVGVVTDVHGIIFIEIGDHLYCYVGGVSYNNSASCLLRHSGPSAKSSRRSDQGGGGLPLVCVCFSAFVCSSITVSLDSSNPSYGSPEGKGGLYRTTAPTPIHCFDSVQRATFFNVLLPPSATTAVAFTSHGVPARRCSCSHSCSCSRSVGDMTGVREPSRVPLRRIAPRRQFMQQIKPLSEGPYLPLRGAQGGQPINPLAVFLHGGDIEPAPLRDGCSAGLPAAFAQRRRGQSISLQAKRGPRPDAHSRSLPSYPNCQPGPAPPPQPAASRRGELAVYRHQRCAAVLHGLRRLQHGGQWRRYRAPRGGPPEQRRLSISRVSDMSVRQSSSSKARLNDVCLKDKWLLPTGMPTPPQRDQLRGARSNSLQFKRESKGEAVMWLQMLQKTGSNDLVSPCPNQTGFLSISTGEASNSRGGGGAHVMSAAPQRRATLTYICVMLLEDALLVRSPYIYPLPCHARGVPFVIFCFLQIKEDRRGKWNWMRKMNLKKWPKKRLQGIRRVSNENLRKENNNNKGQTIVEPTREATSKKPTNLGLYDEPIGPSAPLHVCLDPCDKHYAVFLSVVSVGEGRHATPILLHFHYGSSFAFAFLRLLFWRRGCTPTGVCSREGFGGDFLVAENYFTPLSAHYGPFIIIIFIIFLFAQQPLGPVLLLFKLLRYSEYIPKFCFVLFCFVVVCLFLFIFIPFFFVLLLFFLRIIYSISYYYYYHDFYFALSSPPQPLFFFGQAEEVIYLDLVEHCEALAAIMCHSVCTPYRTGQTLYLYFFWKPPAFFFASSNNVNGSEKVIYSIFFIFFLKLLFFFSSWCFLPTILSWELLFTWPEQEKVGLLGASCGLRFEGFSIDPSLETYVASSVPAIGSGGEVMLAAALWQHYPKDAIKPTEAQGILRCYVRASVRAAAVSVPVRLSSVGTSIRMEIKICFFVVVVVVFMVSIQDIKRRNLLTRTPHVARMDKYPEVLSMLSHPVTPSDTLSFSYIYPPFLFSSENQLVVCVSFCSFVFVHLFIFLIQRFDSTAYHTVSNTRIHTNGATIHQGNDKWTTTFLRGLLCTVLVNTVDLTRCARLVLDEPEGQRAIYRFQVHCFRSILRPGPALVSASSKFVSRRKGVPWGHPEWRHYTSFLQPISFWAFLFSGRQDRLYSQSMGLSRGNLGLMDTDHSMSLSSFTKAGESSTSAERRHHRHRHHSDTSRHLKRSSEHFNSSRSGRAPARFASPTNVDSSPKFDTPRPPPSSARFEATAPQELPSIARRSPATARPATNVAFSSPKEARSPSAPSLGCPRHSESSVEYFSTSGTPITAFPSLTTFGQRAREKRRVHIVWPPDVCDVSWTDDAELSFMVPFNAEKNVPNPTPPPTSNPNSCANFNANRNNNSVTEASHLEQSSNLNFSFNNSSRGLTAFDNELSFSHLSNSQFSVSVSGQMGGRSDTKRPRHRYNPQSTEDVRSCLKRKCVMALDNSRETSEMSLLVPVHEETDRGETPEKEKVSSPWSSWLLNNNNKDLSSYVQRIIHSSQQMLFVRVFCFVLFFSAVSVVSSNFYTSMITIHNKGNNERKRNRTNSLSLSLLGYLFSFSFFSFFVVVFGNVIATDKREIKSKYIFDAALQGVTDANEASAPTPLSCDMFFLIDSIFVIVIIMDLFSLSGELTFPLSFCISDTPAYCAIIIYIYIYILHMPRGGGELRQRLPNPAFFFFLTARTDPFIQWVLFWPTTYNMRYFSSSTHSTSCKTFCFLFMFMFMFMGVMFAYCKKKELTNDNQKIVLKEFPVGMTEIYIHLYISLMRNGCVARYQRQITTLTRGRVDTAISNSSAAHPPSWTHFSTFLLLFFYVYNNSTSPLLFIIIIIIIIIFSLCVCVFYLFSIYVEQAIHSYQFSMRVTVEFHRSSRGGGICEGGAPPSRGTHKRGGHKKRTFKHEKQCRANKIRTTFHLILFLYPYTTTEFTTAGLLRAQYNGKLNTIN